MFCLILHLDISNCYVGFYDKKPTPRLLREAQEEYRSIKLDPPLDATGKPLPYPAMTNKEDIIDRDAIETIDTHALGVSKKTYKRCSGEMGLKTSAKYIDSYQSAQSTEADMSRHILILENYLHLLWIFVTPQADNSKLCDSS